ncbi:hypothetical protein E2C01_048873 [Portunus trituberculatus]|uniref:Uncharacterized protein n=1 Tax=Portunus trituberculatus TaxID=210409 RepID=A0A5B7GEH8_PORTR|nr:hypothetical protein [Portunus trituberculatus]
MRFTHSSLCVKHAYPFPPLFFNHKYIRPPFDLKFSNKSALDDSITNSLHFKECVAFVLAEWLLLLSESPHLLPCFHRTPLDVNNTAMKLIVFLGVCCLCIGIVAVVIFFRYARAVDNPSSLLPCYHSTTGTRNNSVSSTSPLIVTTLTTDKCKISPSTYVYVCVFLAVIFFFFFLFFFFIDKNWYRK